MSLTAKALKSGLAAYGKWLREAAEKQNLVKYGTGSDRAERILNANPGLSVSSVRQPGVTFPETSRRAGRVIPPAYETHVTLPGGLGGYMELLDDFNRVIPNDTTSHGAYEFAKNRAAGKRNVIAHMMDAKKGGNSTAAVYPMMGEIAAREGSTILPDSYILHDNRSNRLLKSIGTELTHDRPIFIPHEDQLIQGIGWDMNISPMQFSELPNDQRAAVSFAIGQTAKEADLLNNLEKAKWGEDRALRSKINKFIDAAEMDPSSYDMGVFAAPGQVDLGNINETVNFLRNAGIPNIGPDTFRRSQALRYMLDEVPAPDEMVRGLAYCNGGPIQTDGALKRYHKHCAKCHSGT